MRWLFLGILLLYSVELAAREPSLDEVRVQTLATLGYDRSEIAGWRKKARWSKALPRFQVGFVRDFQQAWRLNTSDSVSVTGGNVFIGPDETDFDEDFDQGTKIDLKAVWYLDELIFSRDALAASAEQRDWAREKTRALEEVSEAYFARQRQLAESRRGGGQKTGDLLDRVTARLDAYTDGWFSEELKR